MDTQLKQRLTGAAILVVLAVLLIPELLTGPKTAPDRSPTSTPAAGTEGDDPVRWIDLDQERKDAVAPPQGAPGMAAGIAPATRTPAPAGSGAQPSAAAPAAPARSAAAAAVAPGTVAPAAPAAAASARGAYSVQLGSFASRESAERLATQLRRDGFDTSVSAIESGGRRLHRVRVGPVADRPAAEALAARLAAGGHRGTIVAQP